MQEIEAKLAEMQEREGTAGSAVEVKRGALVAALFDDGSGPAWFRARIEGRVEGEGGKQLQKVTFVDFGNRADLPMSRYISVRGAWQSVFQSPHCFTPRILRVLPQVAPTGRHLDSRTCSGHRVHPALHSRA